MKASEFIKQLEKLIEIHGDHEVNVFDSEKLENGELIETTAAITLWCDDSDKVKGFTVTDQETAIGFD